jgi:pSer/pThr/pTyr-binding forkhead associated (FHA) protein
MEYGRVDVYWPDGPIESYHLDKPTTGLGRSSGNDIVLDTTAISRYHITFALKNQQVFLEDLQSVNGTYVDGVRIAAHEPFPLRGGEEIQIGDVRLIFHPAFEVMAAPPSDITQRIVISQPTYRVELEGPDMAVAPGAYVQASLRIENLSDQPERYVVEIEGLPKGWVRVDRTEMEVDPGSTGLATLSFKPLRRSESQPGDYPLRVRVRSKSHPLQSVDAPTMLQVLPYSGFGIALGHPVIQDGDTFKLYVHNQGNAPLPLTIQGTDSARTLRFHFPSSTLTLGPGEHQTLVGSVGLRRRKLLGQGQEREFAILARSRDAAGFLASVPGRYAEKALLPAWTPVLVVPVVAVLALLLGAVILLLVNRGGDENNDVAPVINSFTVANPTVTLGDPAQLVWNVSGADSLRLVVEQGGTQQPYPLEPGMTTYALPLERSGLFLLALEARSGEATTTSVATVEVLPSVTLTLELLDGEELVRFVEQDVRVTWNVAGARAFDGQFNIWVESPDAEAPLIPSPLEASGYRDLPIAPGAEQGEWLATLYAEGQDSVTASVTQKLTVVYPSCELTAPRTVVRSGPGEAYPALVPPLEGSTEGNPSLSPIARDASGNWLQVNIGVDNPRPGWVRRADFTCSNFDPAHLVITEDYPPLPAATPVAPTPTATIPNTPLPTPTPR